jgi:predicted phage terminase large subunit-like protein
LDPDNRLFMLDWWYGQTSSDVWIERLLDLVERWKPLCCFGEKGVIEKAVRPQLDRRMMERRVYCRMEWLPSIADKATRARAFQSRAAMGLVSLPETADGERVLSQLLTFPAGKHDDAVDVCSLMGAAIDQAHSGIAMPANERSAARSGYAPVRESGGASWRT